MCSTELEPSEILSRHRTDIDSLISRQRQCTHSGDCSPRCCRVNGRTPIEENWLSGERGGDHRGSAQSRKSWPTTPTGMAPALDLLACRRQQRAQVKAPTGKMVGTRPRRRFGAVIKSLVEPGVFFRLTGLRKRHPDKTSSLPFVARERFSRRAADALFPWHNNC